MSAVPAVQQPLFDYAELDAGTRRYVRERAERIHNLARMTATSIVQIGQYLSEVKERLGHGKFGKWISFEFAWEERSAQAFMQVHKRFKTAKFADLTIDVSALYLIAERATPEPVRQEAIRRAASEPVTHAGAQELVRRYQETGQIPSVKTPLKNLISERKKLRAAAELPVPRRTRAEIEEEERLRQTLQANNARATALMTVIRAVEMLGVNTLLPAEIAAYIRSFDTVDRDWHGLLPRALALLKAIEMELTDDARTSLHA